MKHVGKKEYTEINQLLNEKLNEQPFLITAHRGSYQGNVIENTIHSIQACYLAGADIAEIDVIESADGEFYLFHDGNEMRLLRFPENILTLSSGIIDQLFYYNSNGQKVDYKVERLSTVLTWLDADKLINIDRSWNYWPRLLPFLDQFKREKQIILKSPVKREFLEVLENHPVKYMYFPIIYSMDDLRIVEEYDGINLVGAEIIADSTGHELFDDANIQKIIDKNLFVFINSIRLDDRTVLFAGFDDDKAIMEGYGTSWGKIVEKKADIIQTDWPSLLGDYRNSLLKK